MSRPRHFPLHLLVLWLGLILLGIPGVRAAKNDDDSDADKKAKKTSKSTEKPEDDTSKKKKRKDAEPAVETAKPSKPTVKTSSKAADDTTKKDKDKDSGKSTGRSDKSSSKATEKSNDDAPPKKRRHKEPEADKEADSSSKTASKGKNSSKTTDKDSEKTAEKSSGKKSTKKSDDTMEVSKKSNDTPPQDAKDVTDQKADRPRDEKAMHEGEGEFDNESKSKDNIVKRTEEKSGAKRDLSKSSGTSKEMTGWEVVHYQDRDWVTSNSIYRFYRFADHHIEGNVVWFTSPVLIMKAVLGSQELLINNIKFILSNPVEEVNGKILFSRLDLCKLIDPVLRPSYIGHGQPFDTVIVDAGHGGYDSGARGLYGYEKNFALQLAGLLKADLEKRGLKVVLTRSDDTFISLGGRVEFANKVPNSIFVSLHFNSGQSAATGIETYALSPQGASSDYGARSVDALAFNGNQRDSENIALATAIHASVVHHFRLVDRGVKRARWYVLTGLERPGVLFEGGFVTNGNDGQLIAAENFRKELAHTIGDAISNYRRALQPTVR